MQYHSFAPIKVRKKPTKNRMYRSFSRRFSGSFPIRGSSSTISRGWNESPPSTPKTRSRCPQRSGCFRKMTTAKAHASFPRYAVNASAGCFRKIPGSFHGIRQDSGISLLKNPSELSVITGNAISARPAPNNERTPLLIPSDDIKSRRFFFFLDGFAHF